MLLLKDSSFPHLRIPRSLNQLHQALAFLRIPDAVGRANQGQGLAAGQVVALGDRIGRDRCLDGRGVAEVMEEPPRRHVHALVLTEWKKVRAKDNPVRIASDARAQAADYAGGLLGALELRATRYIILVTDQDIDAPGDIGDPWGISFRHIVIPIAPKNSSDF